MKPIKYSVAFCLLFGVGACTQVMVIPQTGARYTVITNASSSTQAAKLAHAKASRICTLKAENLKIINFVTTYQGVDSSQQTLINLAEKVLPEEKISKSYIPEDYAYKATLTFRCTQ